MAGLLISGGIVVDGTGASACVSDIRVRDGHIVEIAPNLSPQGEEVIAVNGAFVAPGFIDSHTHYDAAIFWDRWCDPMPQHGVTTVVIGNCSLCLAPIRSADRDSQTDIFSYVEDVPKNLLDAAIPWRWESYPDYAQALSQLELGVHLVSLVGYSQIRLYVMGAAAWERGATPQEIAAMAAELDRALSAGAYGLSFSLFDKDRQGRSVPSCLANDAEMAAMCEVLASHQAIFQFVPRGDVLDNLLDDIRWVGGFLAPHQVVGFYNIVVHVDSEPERSARILDCLQSVQEQGGRLYGMASPRPFEMAIGFDSTLCLMSVPAWNELVQASRGEKAHLIADPAWRERARHDAETCASVLFPFAKPEELRIGAVGCDALKPWIGRSLRDLIVARGGHASDVLADWLIENDFDTSFIFAIANSRPDDVARLLKSPLTFVSGSDAGAHLQMFCAAGDPTLLLTRYVRERGDLTVEEAVHALSGRQAELLGLHDRGILAPGKAADIVIFDLAELEYGAEYLVEDLPTDGARLTRAPGGFRYTIANGVIVQKNGETTGALPARLLAKTA